MKSNKFTGVFIPKVNLYLCIIFILIIIIAFYMPWIALIGLIMFCYLLYYNWKTKNIRTRKITKYIEDLAFHVDLATKDTLLYFPFPMVVLKVNGIIIWYNSDFANIFKEQEILEKPIQSFVKDLNINKIVEENNSISTGIYYKNQYYYIAGNIVKENCLDEDYLVVLYWINYTKFKNLEYKYYDEKIVEAIVIIDNYDEVIKNVDNINMPQILAEIDKKLVSWFSITNGIIKKFERDKYLLIFENQYLKKFEEKKFNILDDIREINVENNNIPVTLSIGIGLNGGSLSENDVYARAGVDIALGRGGDQVVIKDGNELKFYGGKTKGFEKGTRVRARVVAYALREIILQSDNVIIMGHENSDMDCVGASIGLYRAAKNRDKETYIVLDSFDPAVKSLLSKFKDNNHYDNVFISKNESFDFITDKTLVIVVDTHRATLTVNPELLNRTERVVVIDHHRRSAEFIDDAVLVYHEPYASSTCEMVTEILQYIEEKIKLSVLEAEALYAGIRVDTKNFSFKTGVRTFEAASFLRRAGVDTTSVKQLFQNDLDTYITRGDIVKAAQIYKDNIAIAICPENIKNAQLIVAQAADELLNISGIIASFVMCKTNEKVSISGRSLGNINVQIILEKLGGGGHLTVAGAQIEGISLEETKVKLQNAIDEYFEQMNLD